MLMETCLAQVMSQAQIMDPSSCGGKLWDCNLWTSGSSRPIR